MALRRRPLAHVEVTTGAYARPLQCNQILIGPHADQNKVRPIGCGDGTLHLFALAIEVGGVILLSAYVVLSSAQVGISWALR